MNLTMIVNPHAGRKQGMAQAEYAARKLRGQGMTIEILISEKPGESFGLAENLDLGNKDGVIAVGGDGTLFEVINGLLKNRDSLPLPLGQIPVGTGNSFIRDLGMVSVDDALEKIISGKSRPVDLGRFSCSEGEHYFANLLGSGFVSNVAYRARKYKLLGSLSYILGVLEEIVFLKTTTIELEADGIMIRREAIFTEICNSRFTGGEMMMAPEALIDDGMLDIIILNKASRGKLLSLFPSIFKGAHVNDPLVESFRARKITLHSGTPLLLTPDGETFGRTPIEVTLHPEKIEMFC